MKLERVTDLRERMSVACWVCCKNSPHILAVRDENFNRSYGTPHLCDTCVSGIKDCVIPPKLIDIPLVEVVLLSKSTQPICHPSAKGDEYSVLLTATSKALGEHLCKKCADALAAIVNGGTYDRSVG